MRKLKLQVQMSVDGFMGGPNGEMDWLTWNWDDPLKKYVMDLTAPVDTILLGRKLAEGFIPHWTAFAANPETADEFSRKMVDTHKVVFTKTLSESIWNQTALADGDLATEVNKLKNQEGSDMIAYGGGAFVASLLRAELVDEIHLFVNPAAVGAGLAVFGDSPVLKKLKLEKATPFECGIVVLHYSPAK